MFNTDEDPIEKIIGPFGKYQIWIFILITIGRLPTEFQLMNVVFVIPSVKYVCLDKDSFNQTNYCPCQNPKYDESDIVNSVTSEWNLICESEYLASLLQSMLQIGILAGGLIFGYISDRYGRKMAIILALFSEALFGFISGVVPQFWMLFVMRILIGCSAGGTVLCCYIMNIEIVGKSFRHYVLGLNEVAYITGYSLLPVAAYFIRDWRYLQISLSAPWFLVILMPWLLPESPRWLITMGKTEQAIALLTHIAKRNGRPVEYIEQIVTESVKQSMSTKEQKHGTYLDLFKTSELRRYTVIIAVVWACCTGTYYGGNQFIGRLRGDLYLNVFITAVSYIPAISLLVIASIYLKRKTTMIGISSIAAICFAVTTFMVNMPSVSLAFIAIAIVSAYSSFLVLFLICSEVFPTVIRNRAMSFCSMFGRIGGFVAPFIVNIGIDWVSLLIFSCFALFATLLCILLPETKNITLPNSIQQARK